MTFLIRRRHS